MLRLLRIPHQPISWLASCMGAFLGTFSHVVLDAIMHSDTEPWWPLSSANPFLGLVSVRALHLACLAGVAFWLVLDTWRNFRKRRHGGAADHQ